jgi:hypothetical protein
MAGIHVRFEVSPEALLGDLTEAAYRVALKHGIKVPFVEIELDLQKELRRVIQKDMVVSEACGSPDCLALKMGGFGPFSDNAKKLIREDR